MSQMVALGVLGPLELSVDGELQTLPRSKKTRALLAYLAVTGRPHRRDRLCELLWDVADDPRAALRWSLSRLRRGIGWDRNRLTAGRDEVAFDTVGLQLDALELTNAENLAAASTAELERLAHLPRGAFLEGLDLPDFHDFGAWCVGQREQLRKQHCAILGTLVARLRDAPADALPYARMRAEQDSLGLAAQKDLLALLVNSGLIEEAEKRYENCERLFRDLGADELAELEGTWTEIFRDQRRRPALARTAPAKQSYAVSPFVGRSAELDALEDELSRSRESDGPRVVLVTGEPGAGKTRLAERLMARAENAGFATLSGRAYEAERRRPYGPWADALGVDIGGSTDERITDREELFSMLMDALAAASSEEGAVLLLDDLQWLDRDSVELLHFAARTYRSRPLLLVLTARVGEISDNVPATRAMRSLGKERRLETLELEPLSSGEVAELLTSHGIQADAETIHSASAGNPLYAIELGRAGKKEGPPQSLIELVRERVDQLPDRAVDVLRWGAVLGHSMSIERLEAVSSFGTEELVEALEDLEKHALLRIDAARAEDRYVFTHDVVREAVYSDLSHPRRRLMHKKVVEQLVPQSSDVSIATEIAHHAPLAGEALHGAEACLVAGRQSLRVFANAEAETLARRGLHLAESLSEADRIRMQLELLHLTYSARVPDREQAAEIVRKLAEEALDRGLTHAARLGFQMLSFLRWESSSMARAHDNIMQAERVSRSSEPAERTIALAQAAKCLLLLERNLGQAEAFVMEADGLTTRGVSPTSTVALASGMIAAHRGKFDVASDAFVEARDLARQSGDRLTEFGAVEQWVMLEIDRGRIDEAADLALDLVDLGERVRSGVEAPSGRALSALIRLLRGETEADADLRTAIEELRALDAKYQLSYVLTRRAEVLLESDVDAARSCAGDALVVAEAIRRPSEIALARAALIACGDEEHRAPLEAMAPSDLSWKARAQIEQVLKR